MQELCQNTQPEGIPIVIHSNLPMPPLHRLRHAGLMLVMLVMVLPLSATHIVGGEISYEDLGGGSYRIRLVVYRDCGPTNQNGTGFDDAASVGIFNANGQLVNSISIPLSFQNVNEVPVTLENPCGTPPPSVCVEQAVYQQIVDILSLIHI